MLYHTQAYATHNFDKGEYADCLRTCIACLLSVDRDEVPNLNGAVAKAFFEQSREAAFKVAFDQLNDYLKPLHMLWYIPIKADSPKAALNLIGKFHPNSRYILVGGGPKDNHNHAVCCIGNKIEWDPHPLREKINTITRPLNPGGTHFIMAVIGARL